MQNAINMEGFIQICLVVDDIKKAAGTWAEMFGIPVPDIHEANFMPDPDQTYRGQTANYKVKVANIKGPGFVIELHEPDGNPSTFREFLDKHGNGVHHLGFEVGERRDAIVDELSKRYALRTVGYYPGSSWTIMDTEDDLGVNLNIKPVR